MTDTAQFSKVKVKVAAQQGRECVKENVIVKSESLMPFEPGW